MPTQRQAQSFNENLLDSDTLQRAIDWIGENLQPEDVFKSSKLEEWALENGYKEAE